MYIGGADLGFAGKERFYPDHGFTEIIGLNQIQEKQIQPLPVSRWGIYDDTMFEIAFEKFKLLSSKEQPFSLFLLTLDTHPPYGHKTPTCRDVKYGNHTQRMLNAVKCADKLIAGFVARVEDYAQAQGKDLIVIVASDHLMLRNEISETLESKELVRENLFFARSPDISPQIIARHATTLDIAPTVLSLLGWDVEAMALGRNLLKPGSTLVEKYGEKNFFDMVQSWRLNLWKTWVPRG